MTLESLVANINDLDDDLVIFQEKELSMSADVVLFERGDDSMERVINNIRYVYFLEVFIAKEIINDWVNSLKTKPSTKDIALRLFEYAINDA